MFPLSPSDAEVMLAHTLQAEKATWIGGTVLSGRTPAGFVPMGLAKVPRGCIPYSIVQHTEMAQGMNYGQVRGSNLTQDFRVIGIGSTFCP